MPLFSVDSYSSALDSYILFMPLVPSCLSNIEKYFLSVDDCSTVLDDYSVVMSVVPSYVVSVEC